MFEKKFLMNLEKLFLFFKTVMIDNKSRAHNHMSQAPLKYHKVFN